MAAAFNTDELTLRDLEDRCWLGWNNLLSFRSETFISLGFGVLKIERFSAN